MCWLITLLLTLVVSPLHPRPVAVDISGVYAWAYVNRVTGERAGSPNAEVFTSTVESMIKPWIAADYLRRTPDPAARLGELRRMIVDSDDVAAEDIYRAGGADAVTGRMVAICGLTRTRIHPAWWSLTTTSAADAARLGQCLADGRAAGAWTHWLLATMRAVRGTVTDQHATTGGGRWGIIDALPAAVAAGTAIKNGWTAHSGDGWHVNCLAIHPTFVLTIVARYPYGRGLAYGADLCAQVTRQLATRPARARYL